MSKEKPSLRTSLHLFLDYDAPLTTKLRMAVGNNLTKIRTRKPCCGNPGQPGC